MLTVLLFAFVFKSVSSDPGSIQTPQMPHSYEVSIRFANRHVCNGVIISPKHVLTAAHCFEQDEKKFPNSAFRYMSVVSGLLSNETGDGVAHRIKNVTIQSDFDYQEKGTWHSDIAVVTLASEIRYSRFEQPIKFPTEDLADSIDKARVSVWDSPTDSMTSVDVYLLSHNKCAQRLKEKYLGEHDNKICGHTTVGRALCLNLDGSPLVHEATLIGIGSRSEGCRYGSYQPDVFVNVYRNRAFVKRVMAMDIY